MTAVERIRDVTEEEFRRRYLAQGRPAVLTTSQPDRAQLGWSFEHIRRVAGHHVIPVYDWGADGPTVDDSFTIIRMTLAEFLDHVDTLGEGDRPRFTVCQLPLDQFLPELAREYELPAYLKSTDHLDVLPSLFREQARTALFITSFRGLHWHNGREVVAQLIEGAKRFVLFHPSDTKYLYPRRLLSDPLAWFDEKEAVFCSELPTEGGLESIDRQQFPLFDRAVPMVVDLKPGESLYIPPHWWHVTYSAEPCLLVARFWDSPLRRWHQPLALKTVLMKPYRKYLFRRLIRAKQRLRPSAP